MTELDITGLANRLRQQPGGGLSAAIDAAVARSEAPALTPARDPGEDEEALRNLLRELLGVDDSLARLLVVVKARDSEGKLDPRAKKLLAGFSSAQKQLRQAIRRQGVTVIERASTEFDPETETITEAIEDASVPHGTVLAVELAGYRWRGGVLRPAEVRVARGGPISDGSPILPPAPAPAAPMQPYRPRRRGGRRK